VDKNFATLSSARAYNTITNEWADLANMPEDGFGGTADAVKGKIYMIGGLQNVSGNWNPANSTLEYDPAGDGWQEKTGSPAPKGAMSSCVLNDTIYILGGNPQGQRKVWYYVPATDSWDSLPDMINERPAGSSAVILDNKIYVIGGTIESGLNSPLTGKSEVYDPQSKVWIELADMPVPVGGHFSVVYDHKILVFGGDSSSSGGTSIGTNCIQEYDPSVDSWRLLQNMPFNRASMGGEIVDGFVYLIGGYLTTFQNPPFSEVWRFNLDSLFVSTEEPDQLAFSIYPNPTKDRLTIETDNHGPHTIEITSLNGQLILSVEMEGTTQQLDLSSFQSGVYFITIRSKDFVTTRKIIKP
jgi:N-acetylneuraminic acid mutarotase